ncbi:MAG: MBL fold metallo-hydrolase [Chloroflexota bacterium]
MISEIFPGFYHLDLPYPRHPLHNINIYLVRGSARSLLIDTGVDIEECRETLTGYLKELGVKLGKTDFFITHGHRDHFGLLPGLATETSVVYVTRNDATLMKDGNLMWERRLAAASSHGFPGEVIEDALRSPPYNPSLNNHLRFRYLKQDDTLSIGKFKFLCLETPGHSKGHLCLYEPKNKFILTGDHVLFNVSPNVSCWSMDENPLADYLNSLDKVYKLDVELALPGHRKIMKDLKGRVRELKEHHEKRASEALSILEQGPMNAYAIASAMTWDIPCDTWEEVPTWQKFSAVGETISHLNYLEARGEVKHETSGGEIVYSLK